VRPGQRRRALVARMDPASGVREGDSVRLYLDPAQIHLFEAASGAHLP